MTRDEKKKLLEKYGSELLEIQYRLKGISTRFCYDEGHPLKAIENRTDDCPIDYYNDLLGMAREDMTYAEEQINTAMRWISGAIEELDFYED